MQAVLSQAGYWIQGQGGMFSKFYQQRIGWKTMKKACSELQKRLLLRQQQPRSSPGEVDERHTRSSGSISSLLPVVEICHCLYTLWYGRSKIARRITQDQQAASTRVIMEQAELLLRRWFKERNYYQKKQQPAATAAAASVQLDRSSHNDRSNVKEVNAANWTSSNSSTTNGGKQDTLTASSSQSSTAPTMSLWPPLSVAKNTLPSWPLTKNIFQPEDQKPAAAASIAGGLGGKHTDSLPTSSLHQENQKGNNNNTAAQSLSVVVPTPVPDRQWTSVEWNAKSTSPLSSSS
jgi:hypothetical protein